MRNISIYVLFLLFVPLVSAVDFTPSGNINGRNIYHIYNFSNITAKHFYYTNGVELVNGGGGGSSYNQDLNTTANVTFVKVSATKLLGDLDWTWLQQVPAYVTNYSSDIDSKLNISDASKYNESVKINNVNTSANMQSLGFNTTVNIKSWFDTLYYSASNPNSYLNSVSLGSAIIGLGSYNTTTELNTLYYSILNPKGFINETYANSKFNDTTYINGKFGTLTDNNWCIADGGKVVCEQTAPATVTNMVTNDSNLNSRLVTLTSIEYADNQTRSTNESNLNSRLVTLASITSADNLTRTTNESNLNSRLVTAIAIESADNSSIRVITTALSGDNTSIRAITTNLGASNQTMYASNSSQATEINNLRTSNLTKALPGTCAAGTYVQNTTTTGVDCMAVTSGTTYTATNPGLILTSTAFSLNETRVSDLITNNAVVQAKLSLSDAINFFTNKSIGDGIATNVSNLNISLQGKASNGTCASGTVIQNVTSSAVQCITPPSAPASSIDIQNITGAWANSCNTIGQNWFTTQPNGTNQQCTKINTTAFTYTDLIINGTTRLNDTIFGNNSAYFNASSNKLFINTNGDYATTATMMIYGDYDSYRNQSTNTESSSSDAYSGFSSSSSRGTGINPLTSAPGDFLGGLRWYFYNNTNAYTEGAYIESTVTTNTTSSNIKLGTNHTDRIVINDTNTVINTSINLVDNTLKCPDESYLTTDPTTGLMKCVYLELYHHPRYYKMTDFESTTAVYNTPWVLGAIASGTAPILPGEVNHPGIVQFNTSTSASSGYVYNIASAFVYSLNTGWTTEAVFRPYTKPGYNASIANGNNTLIKFGFQDVITGADSVDGVYFNITQVAGSETLFNVTLIGSSNNARVFNYTGITLTNNTWYTATIYINSTSFATGIVKDASGTVLWTGTVATVPNGVGRETSNNILAMSTAGGVPGARKILDVDFISVGFEGKLVR